MWKKSLLCPGFPHKDVIDEFLIDRDKLPTRNLVWKRPKMFHFMVKNTYTFVIYTFLGVEEWLVSAVMSMYVPVL